MSHAPGGDGPIGRGAGEEEVARPGGLPVGAEDLQQPRREHDVAILLPLALADADDHALAVDVGDAQAGDLGDPQAGGIGGHEQGAVLEVGDGGEEAGHLVGAQDDRESAGLLGRGDARGDIVAAQGLAVEEAQGAAGLVIVAHGDVPLLEEMEQVVADVFGAEVIGRGVEVAGEAGDASDVGLDGRRGEVAEGHVVDHAAAQGCHVRLLCE